MFVANTVTKEDSSNLKFKQIVDNIINYKRRAGIKSIIATERETRQLICFPNLSQAMIRTC
ncbi:hypothetical protein H5410_033389 [Solanum commersonii]|uniref:Uncharacterized protein n=1 Tax=Solanum commersonii TaxID=4109 RepID=A0A9J5YMM9_SOLCO|nr:hypothetical protein H5410_033389 [Solanum commersonii]